eukprot:scaffold83313_cov94-Phaeocystis_antarctica.AAC.3
MNGSPPALHDAFCCPGASWILRLIRLESSQTGSERQRRPRHRHLHLHRSSALKQRTWAAAATLHCPIRTPCAGRQALPAAWALASVIHPSISSIAERTPPLVQRYRSEANASSTLAPDAEKYAMDTARAPALRA